MASTEPLPARVVPRFYIPGNGDDQPPRGYYVPDVAYDALEAQLEKERTDHRYISELAYQDRTQLQAERDALAQQLQQAQADRDYWKLKYHEK